MKNPPLSALHGIWATPARNWEEQVTRVVDHLIRRNNVHEVSLRAFALLDGRVEPSNREAPVICDIGANQGQSVISLKNLCPNAHVHSFDPLPWCVRSLEYLASERHAFPDGFSLSVYDCALSDAAANLPLYIPGSPDYMFTTLASGDKSRIQSPEMLRYIQAFFSETLDELFVHEARLRCETLDSFHLKPSGIKIDVEGFETAVLRGGINTISEHKPLLVIETGANLRELDSLLEPLGYRKFGITSAKGNFELYQKGNSIYLTDRHVKAAETLGLM